MGTDILSDEEISASAGVSNTPAQNTQENGTRLLVDWVSASFYSELKFFEIQQLFGLHSMEVKGEEHPVVFDVIPGARYKYQGYDFTYKYNAMEILYASKENKYLINFSGQACREFETISNLDYELFFGLLKGTFHASFNRIDVAIDDFKNIFRVNTIRKAVVNGQAITKLQYAEDKRRFKIKPEQDRDVMDSFYLGSLNSRYAFNIYDKKLEQIHNRDKVVTVDTWTRFEVRLKESYADNFAIKIATSTENEVIGKYIMEFINQSLCFIQRKHVNKNRSRAAKDKANWTHWWKKYIGDVGKLKLSQKAPDKSVERTVSWFVNQIAPSLAVLEETDPEGYTYIMRSLTDNGRTRLTKQHEILIRQAKENGLALVEVLDRLKK